MTRSTDRLLVVVAAFVALAWAIPGAAHPGAQGIAGSTYAITDLGDLGGTVCVGSTGHSSSVADFNEVGGVVGMSCWYQTDPWFDRVTAPFVWKAGISRIDQLKTVAAINDAGQMVGGASVVSAGTVIDLGAVLHGFSSAYDINDSGQVVGIYGTPPAIDRWGAYLYDLGTGSVTDLGTLGGTFRSTPQEINDAGHVAGWASTAATNGIHAFLWKSGQMTDLGGLVDGGTSYGLGLNATDQVVGHASVADGDHAFLWSAGTMTDLGTLGGDFSSAWDINDSGVAVGYALTETNSQRAVMWENGVITDLNDLIPADSGWTLTYAIRIDNLGRIVGNGQVGGEQRAFMLTMPPTASILGHPENPTKSATATFTFSAPDAAVYQCRLDEGWFQACAGPVTYTKLPKRSHVFEVRANALAGTTFGRSDSFAWTTGAVPKVSILSKPPVLSNLAGLTFSFASGDPGATFECRMDGAAGAPCTSPHDVQSLSDGRHVFAVTAVDAAGRKSKPALHTWTVDTTAPDTTITTGPPAVVSVNRAQFKFTSSEPNSTFWCSLDGVPFTACKNVVSLKGLLGGHHTFSARATDRAGNTDPTPATWSWAVG